MPTVLVVHPSVRANSLKELVALAKAKPGELNIGSSSSGTVFHLAAELLKSVADINMVHVPFKGGGETVSTLRAGKTVGGVEYMASFDSFTAAITRGLVDADMGTSLTRAVAVQGGDIPNWAAGTNFLIRLTTTTNNTNLLTQGSVTVYTTVEQTP